MSPQTGYQDRIISGLPAVADDVDIAKDYNADGWVRLLRFETRLSRNAYNGQSSDLTSSASLYGLIDTPNYGTLSFDAQGGGSTGGGLLTLRQRGFQMACGWIVNNELGVISSPSLAINRSGSRIAVPGQLMQGISTEWLNSGDGLQLQGSLGSPGRIDGGINARFERLPGTVSSAGAELSRGPWSLATRVANSKNSALSPELAPGAALQNATSVQFSAQHELGGTSVQAHAITTSDSLLSSNPAGLWVDAESRSGSRATGGGLFWLEPGLSWAGIPMANDLSGGYLRHSWQTRQWSAEGTVDLLRSIARPTGTGVFLTGNARWRFSNRISFGMGVSVRRFDGNAWRSFAEVRVQNDWGSTSVRSELTHEADQSRQRKLTVDHDWNLNSDWSLATSLTAGRNIFDGRAQTTWGTAASINAPVTSLLVVRGNFSADGADSGSSRSAINAGLSWRLSPNWNLDGNYILNRGRSEIPVSIDPLATPFQNGAIRSSGSSLFVTLRWETRAGSSSQPLGGLAAQGGGRVAGTVYFDANRNARQDAGEAGVPNVTVYLDSRFTARTDSQGNYEFPYVGTGPRLLALQNETLPLPWVTAGDSGVRLNIEVRSDQRGDFGVIREGSN